MKTTIDLVDVLREEARELTRRDDTTVRALVEHRFREVIAERRRSGSTPFRWRDASFAGDGLRPEYGGTAWARLREAACEGRGG